MLFENIEIPQLPPADVPTPATGYVNLFYDSVTGRLDRKLSDGTVEAVAGAGGVVIYPDVATIATTDGTTLQDGALAWAAANRTLFTLDKTATAGDFAAVGGGFWSTSSVNGVIWAADSTLTAMNSTNPPDGAFGVLRAQDGANPPGFYVATGGSYALEAAFGSAVNWQFLPSTGISPAVAGNPTEAEVTAWAAAKTPKITSAYVRYTGTVSGSAATKYAWIIDSNGEAREIVKPATNTDTIQNLNATGTVTAWGSVVIVGATALTANATLTLPTITTADVGKTIKFVRQDATAFTVTLAAASGQTMTLSNAGTELNSKGGGLTVEATTSATVVQATNNVVSYMAGKRTIIRMTADGTTSLPATNAVLPWENVSVDVNELGVTFASNVLTIKTGARPVRLEAYVLTAGTGAANIGMWWRRTADPIATWLGTASEDGMMTLGRTGQGAETKPAFAILAPNTTFNLNLCHDSSANNQKVQANSTIIIEEAGASTFSLASNSPVGQACTFTANAGAVNVNGAASFQGVSGFANTIAITVPTGKRLDTCKVGATVVPIAVPLAGLIAYAPAVGTATVDFTVTFADAALTKGSMLVGSYTGTTKLTNGAWNTVNLGYDLSKLSHIVMYFAQNVGDASADNYPMIVVPRNLATPANDSNVILLFGSTSAFINVRMKDYAGGVIEVFPSHPSQTFMLQRAYGFTNSEFGFHYPASSAISTPYTFTLNGAATGIAVAGAALTGIGCLFTVTPPAGKCIATVTAGGVAVSIASQYSNQFIFAAPAGTTAQDFVVTYQDITLTPKVPILVASGTNTLTVTATTAPGHTYTLPANIVDGDVIEINGQFVSSAYRLFALAKVKAGTSDQVPIYSNGGTNYQLTVVFPATLTNTVTIFGNGGSPTIDGVTIKRDGQSTLIIPTGYQTRDLCTLTASGGTFLGGQTTIQIPTDTAQYVGFDGIAGKAISTVASNNANVVPASPDPYQNVVFVSVKGGATSATLTPTFVTKPTKAFIVAFNSGAPVSFGTVNWLLPTTGNNSPQVCSSDFTARKLTIHERWNGSSSNESRTLITMNLPASNTYTYIDAGWGLGVGNTFQYFVWDNTANRCYEVTIILNGGTNTTGHILMGREF